MTNLFDVARFPACSLSDLYHQRWHIEEAFKRLKHRPQSGARLGLVATGGGVDVAAKVLCDNLQASYYFGLPGGDRTPDPQLRRLMLYPTELRAET